MEQALSDEVAEGVRAGDPGALSAAWRAFAPELTRYLTARLRDPHLAEDIAEDTFFELVRSCRTIDGGAHGIRGWLYRAATRNLIDHRRAGARRREDLVAAPPDRSDCGLGPAEQAESAELRAAVHAGLGRLTPDQRQVLTLRFLIGMTAPEVAAAMGKPEGAVRALQHRGIAAFGRLDGDVRAGLAAAGSAEPR